MRKKPAIFKVGISSVHIFNFALAWLSCLHILCVSAYLGVFKMPVSYPPPSVGTYTRTPSHQPLLFGRKGIDHLP